jgi:hypothetical protein
MQRGLAFVSGRVDVNAVFQAQLYRSDRVFSTADRLLMVRAGGYGLGGLDNLTVCAVLEISKAHVMYNGRYLR